MDGRVVDMIYRPSIGAGSWQLPAWSNALYVGQTPSSPPAVSSGEGWLVNGSNQGDLNFPGLTTDATPLAADIFAFHDDVDSEHKGITYSALSGLLGVGGGIKGVQFLTASGTYTKTAGTTKALVFVTGGGGGGDGGPAGTGGGGAGATAIAYVDLTGIPTVAVTLGAGGTGGTVNHGGGGAGGSTSFGTHAVAGGGAGGTGAYGTDGFDTPGGAGGVASVGLMQVGGDAGGHGRNFHGAPGGASYWGGAGQGGYRFTDGSGSEAGFNATGWGSGGGGADSFVYGGGAGKQGCILVVEFG
jgi:hypothetical protein